MLSMLDIGLNNPIKRICTTFRRNVRRHSLDWAKEARASTTASGSCRDTSFGCQGAWYAHSNGTITAAPMKLTSPSAITCRKGLFNQVCYIAMLVDRGLGHVVLSSPWPLWAEKFASTPTTLLWCNRFSLLSRMCVGLRVVRYLLRRVSHKGDVNT